MAGRCRPVVGHRQASPAEVKLRPDEGRTGASRGTALVRGTCPRSLSLRATPMPQLLTCLQGHQWQDSDDSGTEPSRRSAVCPRCGGAPAPATLSESSAPSLPLNEELPPRPSPLPTAVAPTTAKPGDMETAPPDGGQWPAVPGYEILEVLGRGGMGVVYKARQKSLNRLVALKMILAGSNAGPEQLARFRGEADTIAQLRHPNFVHIYDIGDCHLGGGMSATPFFALEFVEGGSLNKRIAAAQMSPRQAAELVATLARAMSAAHQAGIVHRDLKPANILLMADGTPKITDFGLAKHLGASAGQTQSGAILGTPSYMAPEQASGQSQAIGPATDIYALGAILYELLTGRPPFRGEDSWSTVAQVMTQAPVPPSQLRADVPPELEKICLKCLEKEPAQRPASAAELAEALGRFLSGPLSPTQTLPLVGKEPPGPRRLSPWTVAGSLAVAVVVVLLGVGLWLWLRPPGPSSGSESDEPSWETLSVDAGDERLERIAFPTRKVGYVASRQAVYRTEDAGRTWKRLPLAPEARRVHCLHMQDARVGWLATHQLLHTTDGGTHWSAEPLPEKMDAVSGLAFGPGGWGLAGGTGAAGDLVLVTRSAPDASWETLNPNKAGTWVGDEQSRRRWRLGKLANVSPQGGS